MPVSGRVPRLLWKPVRASCRLINALRPAVSADLDGAKPIEPARLNRIVVHAPNWLGDAVMSLPLLRHVRAVCPAASIAVVSPPTIADLWKLWPDADEVIAFDALSERLALSDLVRFVRRLRARAFDAAVILPGGIEFALLHALAGIPIRIGYASDQRRRLLTHAQTVSDDNRSQHQSERYLSLLRLIDKGRPVTHDVHPPGLTLGTTPSRQRRAIFHPWANYGPAKRWPAASFAELGSRILERCGAEVVLVGTADGAQNAAEINRQLRHRALDLTGRTSLRELCDVLRDASVVVSNDSGPAHLADALGVPVIVLFGSSSPTWTAPRGAGAQVVHHPLECSPCFGRTCRLGTYACLHAITVDEVFERIERVLSAPASPARIGSPP